MRILRAFASLLFAAVAFADPPAPTLADGMAQMQKGDAAAAAAIFEQVVARDSNNARAWRSLGLASRQSKQYPRALEAFQRALAIDPANPSPLYEIGAVNTLEGRKDAAFEWLAKAKATHKIDMTKISLDKALESLKSDPRFAALLPTAKDFQNPFVERVKVIREWDGEHAGDQFGWIARNIGDVDGDHVADVVTSAPSHGDDAGRIYVYSTRSGKLLWTADGQPKDELGTGVEAAGDANADGVPDVIASGPGGGHAYIYSGKDGHVLWAFNAESKDDDFGRHCSGAGDVNHDGYADVIVGAPQNGANGKGAGRSYVYSGKDGTLLLTLTGEREQDAFGSTVAGWADKTRALLIVGAPGAGPRKTGRTYVYDSLSAKPKFVMDSDETGRALGAMFVAVAGDVDGDGMPDVYASDWSNGAKGPSTGRVYVASGADGHPLFTFTGETAGDGFGTSPSVAGDVDHDGHADFIVGAWQYSGAAIGGGRAYLYSGKDGHLMKTFTCRTPGDTFGFDSVNLGDVDGDGTTDFLITSGWSGVKGFHSGRVFVISSGVKR